MLHYDFDNLVVEVLGVPSNAWRDKCWKLDMGSSIVNLVTTGVGIDESFHPHL